jgi:hypothetical protein
MDFTTEDRLDPVNFNRILWKGMMGNKPYPAGLARIEPRQDREELLERDQRLMKQKVAPASKTGSE